MLVTYLHWIGGPRYVGEGIPGREKIKDRGSIYGKYLKKNNPNHICILVLGSHSNKTSSLLNEQGLISWMGMKVRHQGPLLNAIPYGDMGCGHGMSGENNPSKRPEVREKMSKTRKGAIVINNGITTKVVHSEEEIPEGWVRGLTDQGKERLRIQSIGERNGMFGKTHSEEVRLQMSIERTGKKHWTDGKTNKFQKDCPGSGWYIGIIGNGPRTLIEVECPHCGKVGKGGNMTRYHFDNCPQRGN